MSPYTHNYASLSTQMSKGSPAVEAKRLGMFWTTTIGAKEVVVFKSDSHLSQDTNKHFPADGQLPNAELWKQIIREVQPKLVLTTGTAGGIGKQFEVGDVVVSAVVRFDTQNWLKKAPFANAPYVSEAAKTTFFSQAKDLFKANASQLPPDNTRPPAITVVSPSGLSQSIVTTDFFGFDTSDNHFKLQGLGDASEMGDAVLGMVAKSLGASAPLWLAIRNVSDPRDRRGRHAEAASSGGGNDLQGLWALELRLQRHRLLGRRRRSLRPPLGLLFNRKGGKKERSDSQNQYIHDFISEKDIVQ